MWPYPPPSPLPLYSTGHISALKVTYNPLSPCPSPPQQVLHVNSYHSPRGTRGLLITFVPPYMSLPCVFHHHSSSVNAHPTSMVRPFTLFPPPAVSTYPYLPWVSDSSSSCMLLTLRFLLLVITVLPLKGSLLLTGSQRLFSFPLWLRKHESRVSNFWGYCIDVYFIFISVCDFLSVCWGIAEVFFPPVNI